MYQPFNKLPAPLACFQLSVQVSIFHSHIHGYHSVVFLWTLAGRIPPPACALPPPNSPRTSPSAAPSRRSGLPCSYPLAPTSPRAPSLIRIKVPSALMQGRTAPSLQAPGPPLVGIPGSAIEANIQQSGVPSYWTWRKTILDRLLRRLAPAIPTARPR
jgi:hypothetical protein